MTPRPTKAFTYAPDGTPWVIRLGLQERQGIRRMSGEFIGLAETLAAQDRELSAAIRVIHW